MALRGTDPESYIAEYTLVYEENSGVGANLRRSLVVRLPTGRSELERYIESSIIG